MQDKSFQQAIQDLQDRLVGNFQDTVSRMTKQRTTVREATSDIQDEWVRTVVANTLIRGQMIALFTLMKDMQILNDEQYNELTEYLMNSIICESCD